MVEKAGTDIQETLSEREVQHGSFRDNAVIEVKLRHVLNLHGGRLGPTQNIAVGRIMMKLGRILGGGHRHSDTWHDIAGYALMIEKEILDE